MFWPVLLVVATLRRMESDPVIFVTVVDNNIWKRWGGRGSRICSLKSASNLMKGYENGIELLTLMLQES